MAAPWKHRNRLLVALFIVSILSSSIIASVLSSEAPDSAYTCTSDCKGFIWSTGGQKYTYPCPAATQCDARFLGNTNPCVKVAEAQACAGVSSPSAAPSMAPAPSSQPSLAPKPLPSPSPSPSASASPSPSASVAPAPSPSAPATSTPGGVASRFGADKIYATSPSNHVSLSLSIPAATAKDSAALTKALQDIISMSSYDDPSLWKPLSSADSAKIPCAVHGQARLYDGNPTQMLIGIPSETIRISETPGKVRLPDKYFAMMLSYALDDYGLNPGLLIGLSCKETFATFASETDADAGVNGLLVKNADDVYNGYVETHLGYMRDNNGDGPFQMETGASSTDFSAFAQRFFVGTETNPDNRTPSFTYDSDLMQKYDLTTALHNGLVRNLHKSVAFAALDMHLRHNILMLIDGLYFRKDFEARTTREAKDALEFAAMLYGFNQGMSGSLITKLKGCASPTADPVNDCTLNGVGGHTTNAQLACRSLETGSKPYDFQISKANLDSFIGYLQETFSFTKVGGPAPTTIDWKSIQQAASNAFDVLQAHRAQKAGGSPNSGISYRYDWRTLLSAIRSLLPAREYMVGPSWESLVRANGGLVTSDATSPVTASGTQVASAGSRK